MADEFRLDPGQIGILRALRGELSSALDASLSLRQPNAEEIRNGIRRVLDLVERLESAVEQAEGLESSLTPGRPSMRDELNEETRPGPKASADDARGQPPTAPRSPTVRGVVYLGTHDGDAATNFVATLAAFWRAEGLEFEVVGQPRLGSFLQRFRLIGGTKRLVQRGYRRLAATAARLPEAQADSLRLTAAADLIKQVRDPSLGEVLVLTGNHLLVKTTPEPGEPSTLVFADLDPAERKKFIEKLDGKTPPSRLVTEVLGSSHELPPTTETLT